MTDDRRHDKTGPITIYWASRDASPAAPIEIRRNRPTWYSRPIVEHGYWHHDNDEDDDGVIYVSNWDGPPIEPGQLIRIEAALSEDHSV